MTASETVRLREEALADLACDELAHRVEIGLQALEQLFVLACLLLATGFDMRETGSVRHGGRRVRGAGVFAVGAVGALLSFSRVAGAVCEWLNAREHDRGWRSWVRSSRVVGGEVEGEMGAQSRVEDVGKRWARQGR